MGDLKGCEVFTDHQQELYLRLQNYCFDAPGGAVTFAAKLACEQGWSVAKSERVLGEYRRFLFLAMVAGHPVSPSRAVDLAWHQHLLDTRSYWQEFCPRVLGQPLHHTPSRGSEEERQRLGKRYRRTLASYRACFGEAPPADLWPAAVSPAAVPPAAGPPADVPLAAAPRPPRRVPNQWGILLASVVLALVLGGCKAGYQNFPFSLSGPDFLLLYLVVAGGALVAVLAMHKLWGEQAWAGDVIVIGGVWLLGAVRIFQGLSLNRPVVFVFFAHVLATIFLFKALANDLVPKYDKGDIRKARDDGGGGSDMSNSDPGCC
jgi:hypothetical protein